MGFSPHRAPPNPSEAPSQREGVGGWVSPALSERGSPTPCAAQPSPRNPCALTYSDIGIYSTVPRSSATIDAFAAIAEPRRRELLAALANPDTPHADVSTLVRRLRWSQPQVSKHLAVLRRVGLVGVTRVGRRRVYTLNADALRPVYDWVRTYEHHWDHQLNRIKARAEAVQQQLTAADPPPRISKN